MEKIIDTENCKLCGSQDVFMDNMCEDCGFGEGEGFCDRCGTRFMVGFDSCHRCCGDPGCEICS